MSARIGGLGGATVGVLGFDAHGDFNPPETTLGRFLDGMALATVVGWCWTALAAGVPGFAPVADEDRRDARAGGRVRFRGHSVVR